ncbi:MAG: hypothetical protein HFH67_12740 [Lachnospiraceae bacterium]|nr:hypothetical protein [Lachnospiraceae bacterium]
MPIPNERERHMEMLRAALPYVPPENRHAMEILLQANSLVNLAMQPPSAELEGCDIEGAESRPPFMPDPEAMLMNIKQFCNKKESETIQVLLNFIHADKLFKSYRDFAHSHPDMLEASEINNNSTTPLSILFQLINGLGSISSNLNKNNTPGGNFMMEFLMSQLPPEQKSAFEQLQGIMVNS